MADSKSSRAVVAGASLGNMMLRLDIVPDQVSQVWYGVPLARAIERCLACESKERCAAWLADPGHNPGDYCSFCPNAGLLDIAKRE